MGEDACKNGDCKPPALPDACTVRELSSESSAPSKGHTGLAPPSIRLSLIKVS